ncbi:MAG: NAD-dependent epimerase/dehydratase family protein [Patescibacteria group bacterium]
MSFYLVTGGAGFIGSHVCELLLAQGHRVRVLDNLSTGKRENLAEGVELFEADICDLEAIRPAFVDVDGVFHLAAMPSVTMSIEDPMKTHLVNVDGTLNVLMAARDAKVKRLVYSASAAAYGNPRVLPATTDMKADPLNPYALQKYVGELYCQQFSSLFGIETVSLRYFNAYGPRMADVGAYVNVISIFAQQKRKGLPMTIFGDGQQTRDFVHVKDIARANLEAMLSPAVDGGDVLNVGSGLSYSVNDVADIMGGERAYLENPRGKGDPANSLADITETKQKLGWEPSIAFEQGLKELMVLWKL